MYTSSRFRAAARAATTFFASTLLLLSPTMAPAHDYTAGTLHVDHPWARETPPATTVAAGFLKITNRGREADALIGVSSPAAARVEIHETRMEDGVMRMRRMPRLELPAGKSVVAAPGGLHLMLIGLKSPLKAGTSIRATLTFERSGNLDVEFRVSKADAAEDEHAGHSAH